MLGRITRILSAACVAALVLRSGTAPGATPAASSRASSHSAVPAKPATRAKISLKYRSPRNSKRPLRKSTRFIVLHTTEGGSKGSIAKLSSNGECNYVVDKDGCVYLIIDRGRVAYHAGLSMWNGLTDLDNHSIGIEIVGYHDSDITAAQYTALKTLLTELKREYAISDDRVLTHSMVAYGNANHYHKNRHRGRKRCGMLLAKASNRAKFGVYSKPSFDPDLKAGRLKDADPELTRILYAAPIKMAAPSKATTPKPAPVPPKSAPAQPSTKQPSVAESATPKGPAVNVIGPGRSAWDIAKGQYKSASTVYVFPDGKRRTGTEIENWKAIPAGTRVELASAKERLSPDAAPEADDNSSEGLLTVGTDGSVLILGGDAVVSSSTFYFPPSGGFKTGSALTLDEVSKLPDGTQMLLGYKFGGPVGPKKPVFSICGSKWNRDDTYYLKPGGGIVPGDEITEKTIPAGAMVFYK